MAETLKLGAKGRRLDLDVIENGLEREAPMAPGVTFRILPWGTHNPRYRKALQARAQRNAEERKALEEADDPEAAARDYLLAKQEDPEFIVDAVLADIDGLLNGNGNPVKYTRERGVRILSDPEWAHLRDWVVGVAFQAAGKYKEEVEETGKN